VAEVAADAAGALSCSLLTRGKTLSIVTSFSLFFFSLFLFLFLFPAFRPAVCADAVEVSRVHVVGLQ
jgi:hypothetical protein